MKKLLFVFIFLLLCFSINSQEVLKSANEDYYYFLSLFNDTTRPYLGYRTLSDNKWNIDEYTENLWQNNNLEKTFSINEKFNFRVYNPEWYNSYNTAVSYGFNDGALWQGRGYNTALTTGIRMEAYGFELTFKPQLSWSQNLAFESNDEVYPSPYSYSFKSKTAGNIVEQNIDVVRRYGNSSLFTYDWGDSEIRWTWKTLTFGFGTQNPWLGPAYVNPMLGSNNAPGFFKFDAGLRKTQVVIPKVNWNLGYIEGRIWTGLLKESEYFDDDLNNNKRMINGLSAYYAPSFIPGLTIGLNRIFVTNWKADNLYYILRLFTLSHGNNYGTDNDEDQKATLSAEWNFPKAGFTVYGEYGFDDFSSNNITNPFHTGIYTVGINQYIPLPKGLQSELNLEWNNFEMSQDFQLQWLYLGFYSHTQALTQGYTNNGQILGAATCWAGNSQFLQYKVFYPKGYTAFKFHRYCPNNNSVNNQSVNTASDVSEPGKPVFLRWFAVYETYFCLGFESLYYINNNFNITAGFDFVRIYNFNYIEDNTKNNCNIRLNLKYTF